MAEPSVKREHQQQQQQQQQQPSPQPRAANPRPILPRGQPPASSDAASAEAPTSGSAGSGTGSAVAASIGGSVQFDFADIDGVSVPRVFRGEGVAYVAVWMVELKLLWRFPNNYPEELKRRPPLRSSYMTEDEGLLINEINETHCLCEYGAGHDFRRRDNMLVKYEEFMQFYLAVRRCFPDIAENRPVGVAPDELRQMKGGFVQVNNTVCPYVYRKDIRFVPLAHLQHTGVQLCLPSNLVGFGYYPSPKECAFVNSLSPRLGLKVQIGMVSRMVTLDMVERLGECTLRELNATNPFGSVQYVANPAELRLSGQSVRVPNQNAGVLNVMAVNRPALIGMAPVMPAATFAAGGLVQTAPQAPSAPIGQRASARRAPPANQHPARGNVGGRQRTRAPDTQHQHVQQLVQQQQQPPSKRRRTNEPQMTKETVKESRYGTCSVIKVQGDLTGGRQVCLLAMRPHMGLLPENANQGDYVVLEHVACSLFPYWPAEKLLSVLRCLVPLNKFYKMPAELMMLFQEAFGARLQLRENTLLHLEIFLKNLHYLTARYSEAQPLAENHHLLPRQPAKQVGAPVLQRQPMMHPMQAVLANIGLSSQLPGQLADVIQID